MNKNQDSSTSIRSSTILDRLETTLHACSLETLYTSSITTSRNRWHHHYYPLVIGCYQLNEEPTVTTTKIKTEQDDNETEDKDENQLSTVIQVQGENNTNNNNNNNTTIRRSGELILYSIKIPNQDEDENDNNEETEEGVFKFGQEQQRLDTGIRGGVLDGKWLQYHKFRFENEEEEEEEEETEIKDEIDTDNEELSRHRQQPSLSAGVSSSSSSSYMFATANASGTINIYRLLDDDEQTRKDDDGDGNTGANDFEEGPSSSSSNLRLQYVGSSSDSTSSNDKKEKEKEKDDIGLALSLAWDESSSASLSTLLSTSTSTSSTPLSSVLAESPTTAATKTIQHDSSISATTGQNLLPCLSHCCSSRRIVSSYSKGTIAVHTITAPTALSRATNDSLSLVNVQETHRWKNAHTFFGMPSEVWTVCFATNRYYNTYTDTIISGGDDCTMKVWDLRLCGESSSNPTHHPIFVQKDFTAGVTAVAYHPSCEHLFAVGSYDESVKVYDMRKLSTAVAHMPTVGGGVWRLKWHPTLRHRILIGAMHGGCRIVDIGGGVCGGNDDGNRVSSSSSFSSSSSEEEIRNMHIVKEFTEHKSMAYGADWIHNDKLGNHPEKTASIHTSSAAASCSFYDRQVFIWK